METVTELLDAVELRVSEGGAGRPVLVLHGGGGPGSVAGFAAALSGQARVLAPTHPGFAGTARPADCASAADLAELYRDLLVRRDLRDVLVVGFSAGGWLACEVALRAADRVGALVLVNAVGIAVPGEPITDVHGLSPDQLAELSYHDPARFRPDPDALDEARRAELAGNLHALAVYTNGQQMHDPELRARLAAVRTPVQVVWGESDGIVSQGYGRAFAESFPDGRFALVAQAGHVPQIEQPARLLAVVREFADLPEAA